MGQQIKNRRMRKKKHQSDSDYDEAEDAKHHLSEDEDDDDTDTEELIQSQSNNNKQQQTMNINPSYLGRTTKEIIDIDSGGDDMQIIGSCKQKKKRKRHKKHHSKKKRKKKKKSMSMSTMESANPLSSAFCAVDYLKHRTPLYQVNTINIDNINDRRGELSTAQFVVGDWKFRVLVYPFGVDNVDCSLMNNQFMSVYL